KEAPAHFALPTALVRNGSPLLPEHSMVLVISLRRSAFWSLNVSVNGFATRPVTSSRQFFSSSAGTLSCAMAKNLSFGVIHPPGCSQGVCALIAAAAAGTGPG